MVLELEMMDYVHSKDFLLLMLTWANLFQFFLLQYILSISVRDSIIFILLTLDRSYEKRFHSKTRTDILWFYFSDIFHDLYNPICDSS